MLFPSAQSALTDRNIVDDFYFQLWTGYLTFNMHKHVCIGTVRIIEPRNMFSSVSFGAFTPLGHIVANELVPAYRSDYFGM